MGNDVTDAYKISDELKQTIAQATSDGTIAGEDIATIIEAARKETEESITSSQMSAIMQEIDAQIQVTRTKKVPTLLRVLGGLVMLLGLAATPTIVFAIINIVHMLTGLQPGDTSTTSVILESIRGGIAVASVVVGVIVGYRLLRNRRYNAARILELLILLSAGLVILTIMIFGVGVELIEPSVIMGAEIALFVYLDPTLLQERRLRQKLRELDVEIRAGKGTLGRDLTGRGYIKLDLFNLFWIFMLGCVLGCLGEVIYHYIAVVPGEIQNRTGMLFGPFSPIYGFGGVLMTIALNRFHNKSFIIIFLVSALIGGVFEFFVSWFLETSFGITAWDYTDSFMSIGGRTNAYFMLIWGLAGLIWIKGLLPLVLRAINLVPWKLRYTVTTVCLVLMVINGIMTLQAVDCWYERVSGVAPQDGLSQFYATYFNNDWMANHFQSMSIEPNEGHQTTT